MRRRVSGPIEVTKQVIVLASGETERRALPHLVSHLRDRDVSVVEVRVPPRNRALDVRMAENLIKASWFRSVGAPPDKFVLLSWIWMGRPPMKCWLLTGSYPDVWVARSRPLSGSPARNGISKPGILPMPPISETGWAGGSDRSTLRNRTRFRTPNFI